MKIGAERFGWSARVPGRARGSVKAAGWWAWAWRLRSATIFDEVGARVRLDQERDR